jgi:glucosamine-6-phosphate deaminase
MTTPVTVYATPDELGDAIARRVLEEIDAAHRASRPFLLGCPTGRTPRPIFAAMARRLRERPRPLEHVVLVMMDEYLVHEGGQLVYASGDAPWSCHYFAREEIVAPLNAPLPVRQQIREANVWFPYPRDPGVYDDRIADAGGIDLFLLASGASDGHVAFNPPGSARDSRTRIIELSDETRRDNLQTFPSFGTLDAVPGHGVSVGMATIAASKAAIMVVWGAGKRLTLSRMRAATTYDPSWPATIIHECRNPEIVCDELAAGHGPGATSQGGDLA